MSRALAVARIQLMSWTFYIWPLGIMATSFAINLAVFGLLGDQIPSPHTTYGLISLYFLQFLVGSAGMTQLFCFTVGLNASRRAYYLGTAMVFAAESLGYGVLLYLLKLIEHASGGWGVGLGFFDPIGWTHSENPVQILVYAVPLALTGAAGMFGGMVHRRWGSNGVFALSVASLLAGGLAAIVITWWHAWPTVGTWFTGQSGLALTLGWALVPLAVLAAGTYGLSRRANP
jgi:hypothetical protein